MDHSESNIKRKSGNPEDKNPDIIQLIERISVSPEVAEWGEINREPIFKGIHHKIDSVSHRLFWMKAIAVAASVLLLLGVTNYFSYFRGYTHQNNPWVKLDNPYGTRSSFELSDGTQIVMNAGTSLTYPSVFTHHQREIELTGEAFFDVVSDPKSPFIVKTGELSVQVYGTQFNVKSYPGEDFIEVTLIEGSVGVKTDHQSEIIRLAPNEQFVLEKNSGKITKHSVNGEHYTAWKEGKFYFKDVSFEDIAKQLERAFNVQIVIDSDKLKKVSFTGDFVRGENLDQILRIMTIDQRTVYRIAGSHINISEL